MTENPVYVSYDQMLTGSFMDYAMPHAANLPFLANFDYAIPTQTNSLGIKYVLMPDLLARWGLYHTQCATLALSVLTQAEMPATPYRIWHWLQEARAVAD